MLNLLTNIPAAVWSAIAAIGSFATALFAYRNQRKKDNAIYSPKLFINHEVINYQHPILIHDNPNVREELNLLKSYVHYDYLTLTNISDTKIYDLNIILSFYEDDIFNNLTEEIKSFLSYYFIYDKKSSKFIVRDDQVNDLNKYINETYETHKNILLKNESIEVVIPNIFWVLIDSFNIKNNKLITNENKKPVKLTIYLKMDISYNYFFSKDRKYITEYLPISFELYENMATVLIFDGKVIPSSKKWWRIR